MLALSEIAQAINARLIGPSVVFSGVSTDSRSVSAGELFIALCGENFDGNRFVQQAVERGAVAALVHSERARELLSNPPCPLLVVEDTRIALGRLAALWRGRFKIPVIAVTGSNGKTTVKEMLASILREVAGDDLLATTGNLNNDIGMPLTLLKLAPRHRYAVIEMGMNHPGEIAYLTQIARPDVALINNAAAAHLEGLGTVADVARAKGEIFQGLGADAIAVFNADDPNSALWRELAAPHRCLAFGIEHPADLRGTCSLTEFGSTLSIETPAEKLTLKLAVPGLHNARNALAAAAAAHAAGVASQAIAAGLAKFSGVKGRLQQKAGKNGSLVIDDTYNANPASVSAAIGWLSGLRGETVMVLGDMGELGKDAEQWHREIGRAAARAGIKKLLTLGTLSRFAAAEFGAGSRHFDSIEALFGEIDSLAAPGVIMLVKGSRFMKMERVVEHLAIEQK